MIHIQKKYEDQVQVIATERENLSEKEKYLPLMRFIFFLLTLILFYRFLIINEIFLVYLSVSTLLSFLFLTWWDNLIKSKIERCDRLIQICRNEIKSINGDYSPFESGDEFINPDHNYSHDLDIFGKKSLFQCINRTVTIFGKNRLAEYFNRSYDFRNQIDERQMAIAELSETIEFRQQTQLVFYEQKSVEKDQIEFKEWLNSENTLLNNRLFNVIRFTLPIITNSLVILSLFGLVIAQFPTMMVILQLLVVSIYSRKTLKEWTLLTSKVSMIAKYAQLLLLIEKKNFKVPLLNELKNQLSYEGKETPSLILKKLSGLLNWMDNNLNFFAAVILNGLFLFNLQLLSAIEKWKRRYSEIIPRWFDIIGEFDALSSLGNFKCNNPEYIFPEPAKEKFNFEASNLGHPLIPKAECITNNIAIPGWNQFSIITGANMSGKSTFLRTVGINYVLAMIGAPVFASKFIFYPIILHSSIRTNDSLARKESFFYAELKRLKEIISELEAGQHTFILLDEILKGTNSKDKQAGSIALLEQLIKYQSVGLIATHDLVLGDLIKNYPDNISNFCFEIQIIDDEMSIDYKLQDGVCQNLNATFLMKKMGILIEKG
jgi:hypothetical protein